MNAAVARMDDYRPPLAGVDDLRAEVDRLRALVLSLSDAIDLTGDLGRADALAVAAEAYARGHRDGYERGARMLAAEWPALVKPLVSGRPILAELATRRAAPTGRIRDHDRTGEQIRSDAAASWAAEVTAAYQAGRESKDGGL